MAVYFTVAGHLLNSTRSIGVSVVVAVSFIAIDVFRRHSEKGWLAVSFFSCGLAWTIIAMFATLAFWPEPVPPRPPMPFLVAAVYVVSGQWFSDVLSGIASAIAAMLLYFACFTLATLISSVLAITHFRKYGGWKILIANAPGLIFICYIVVAVVISETRTQIREPGWRITIGFNEVGNQGDSAITTTFVPTR